MTDGSENLEHYLSAKGLLGSSTWEKIESSERARIAMAGFDPLVCETQTTNQRTDSTVLEFLSSQENENRKRSRAVITMFDGNRIERYTTLSDAVAAARNWYSKLRTQETS